MKVTLRNRGGAVYQVDPRAPLFRSLTEQGVDLPIGCNYGGCITCAARLVEGQVAQPAARALNNWQLGNGYILLCVARPRTDIVLEVGVDAHDRLYRNPFLHPLQDHELKADIAAREG